MTPPVPSPSSSSSSPPSPPVGASPLYAHFAAALTQSAYVWSAAHPSSPSQSWAVGAGVDGCGVGAGVAPDHTHLLVASPPPSTHSSIDVSTSHPASPPQWVGFAEGGGVDAKHAADSCTDDVPSGHASHVIAPALEYVPATHAGHAVAPGPADLPAKHNEHVAVPADCE